LRNFRHRVYARRSGDPSHAETRLQRHQETLLPNRRPSPLYPRPP
jgi:hypothetical protein